MADITVDSAVRKDGTITITGTAFTATTTLVTIGGVDRDFTLVSATEISLPDVPGATELTVTKGIVDLTVPITEEEPAVPDEPDVPANPPDVTYTPIIPTPISREDAMTEQEKNPNTDPVGTCSAFSTPMGWAAPTGPKEPYPTGSPNPDAEYLKIHGQPRPLEPASSVEPSEPT